MPTVVAAHMSGLGGVFGQVQKDLDQVVFIAPHRR
jgi:hypothetical protein